MKLYTKAQFAKLLKNGVEQRKASLKDEYVDHKPVIKLFTPDASATWLISEIDPNNHDLAFGLCDLGLGFPELGYVSLEELHTVRGKAGLPVERDLWFTPGKTLSAYADEARERGYIVT